MDIFFVCYGGGHVAIIDALAEYLITYLPQIRFKVLALTTAYPKIKKKYPKNVFGLQDFTKLFSDYELNKAQMYGNLLLEDNHKKDGIIKKEDSVLYLGLSMMDLVEKYGEDLAKTYYMRDKRKAFLPTSVVKKILIHENPKVVCTTNSPRFERASLIVANELGIPNYQIIDLFGENDVIVSKNLIVIDETVKNKLKESHKGKINYYAYGQPAIEATKRRVLKIAKEDVLKKIIKTKTKTNNKRIVYFAQPLPFTSIKLKNQFDTLLKNSFNKLSEMYDIYVRVHPSESDNDYFFLNQVQFITNILSLEESIVLSDIAVTPCSTVALESMSVGKTTFTFHHGLEGSYPFPYFMREPFNFSQSIEELTLKLLNYHEIPAHKKFLTNSNDTCKNIINLLTRPVHESN